MVDIKNNHKDISDHFRVIDKNNASDMTRDSEYIGISSYITISAPILHMSKSWNLKYGQLHSADKAILHTS